MKAQQPQYPEVFQFESKQKLFQIRHKILVNFNLKINLFTSVSKEHNFLSSLSKAEEIVNF